MNYRLKRWRVRRGSTGTNWPTSGAFTPASPDKDWQTFDAHLTQLETSVRVLRQRFEQFRQLQQQQQQIEQRLQESSLSSDEIHRLKQRLDDLEMQLDSAFFDWGSFQEPFWQAIRFGGAGIILGWVLRAIATR